MDLLSELVSELAGSYPSVPFAPGVDAEGIGQDDPEPMYITLPIVRVGGQSANGFTWDAEGVQRVVEEINAKKPEGITGHVKPEERSSRYEPGKLRWVGAALVGETAWAKAYVPRYASDVREYLKLAKRTNARVGTSVYGRRGARGLADMTLESIDLGHPDRLGLREAAVVPHITSEMQTEDETVGDVNTDIIAELKQARDAALEQVGELKATVTAHEAVIAELQTAKATLEQVAGLVAEFGQGDIIGAVTALAAELREARTTALARDIEMMVSELTDDKRLRGLLLQETKGAVSVDAARQIAETYMDSDLYKEIAAGLVREQRGPNAIVGDRQHKPVIEDTPEARANASRFLGF